MSIFVRIWFFFSLILIVVLWFMLYTINQQIKPNVRQVVEDTLAENANIVAQLVAEDVHSEFAQQHFTQDNFTSGHATFTASIATACITTTATHTSVSA